MVRRISLLIIVAFLLSSVVPVQAKDPSVNAVLFYSYESLIELMGGSDPSDASASAVASPAGEGGAAASTAAAQVAVSAP